MVPFWCVVNPLTLFPGLLVAAYNQTFLHARLSLGDDVLKPYKAIINRWLWPDMFKNQDTSVAKAKKSIADYRNAIGQAEGLANRGDPVYEGPRQAYEQLVSRQLRLALYQLVCQD